MIERPVPYQHGHLIHVWQPDQGIISQAERFRRANKRIIQESGLTIVGQTRIVKYPGIGFTFMAALSESGVMAHTWEEDSYANYFLHTCSPRIRPEEWGDIVKKHLKASAVKVDEVFNPQQLRSRFHTELSAYAR